jgi:5-hydroxyisourate hydrolase-like protein (transthyretin family)
MNPSIVPRPFFQRSLNIVGLGIACLGVACLAQAVSQKITVRVLDGKTGEKIEPDNIEVRINRSQTAHIEWVKMNDDGTIGLQLPEAATALSVRATYDGSTDYYVNCDMAKQKDTAAESWYPVRDILTDGLVIPNDCVKAKDAGKVKVDAKPGELVLYVRKRNWKEQALQ